jgi:hypothetical protein
MNQTLTLLATVVTLALTLLPQESSASTILLYKGKTYSSVENHPLMIGDYRKSMRVTGWVELEDPLSPDCVCSFLYYYEHVEGLGEGLLNFSFFDGVLFHDTGNEGGYLRFTTDSKAKIIAWDVYVFDTLGPNAPHGGSDVEFRFNSWSGDYGVELCDNCSEEPEPRHGFTSTGPGRWRVLSVPEPSSLSLLLVGLAGFGLRRARARTTQPQ